MAPPPPATVVVPCSFSRVPNVVPKNLTYVAFYPVRYKVMQYAPTCAWKALAVRGSQRG